MTVKRVVVIGASSGGIDALRTLAASLPSDFAAPICVVVHTSPQSPGVLDTILDRAGALRARTASAGMPLRNGVIYVAPADHHLLIEPGVLRTAKGPRENRFRPAIDPLFRSAAQVYGPGVTGVVLSGSLDDGTAGLQTIKQLGGTAVVQDPADALYASMPQSALRNVAVDHCVPIAELGELLARIVREPLSAARRMPVPENVEVEVKIAGEQNAVDAGVLSIAEPSSFACPDCHGVLLRLKESDPIRFRCHTGHAYSAESLVGALDDGVENGLWSAVRSLEEVRLLLGQLAADAVSRGDDDLATSLQAQGRGAAEQAEGLRKVLGDRAALVMARAPATRR